MPPPHPNAPTCALSGRMRSTSLYPSVRRVLRASTCVIECVCAHTFASRSTAKELHVNNYITSLDTYRGPPPARVLQCVHSFTHALVYSRSIRFTGLRVITHAHARTYIRTALSGVSPLPFYLTDRQAQNIHKHTRIHAFTCVPPARWA